MKRREFLRMTTAATLAQGLFGASPLLASNPYTKLDRFGGWTGKKFKATGFFRVEKDTRWWLVTPEGNAFLSFGINHLEPALFTQDYQCKQWECVLGIENIHDFKEFSPALRKWFLRTCKDFGFNTVGLHNSLQLINSPQPQMAYMQRIPFVDIPHWKPTVPDENFKDIFSDEFARECDLLAKSIADKKKNDPYLLAYSMTDCPLFTEEDCRERTDTLGGARRPSRIGWPRRLRNLGGDAPGKQVYVKTMQNIYDGQISKFNKTYGTRFGSYDALEAAVNWRPDTDLSNANEVRDNIEFLKICVDKYYQVGRDSIRKYDSNHMFWGDKINANTAAMDTVIPVTEKYTDIVMYQMYGKFEVQEPKLNRWAKHTDKPFLNGDSAYTMITDDMPRPYGPVADDLEQRAEWTKEFMEKAFARPDFVGWHYCGLIDATIKHPRKKTRQHSGLLTETGERYPRLEKVIKSCSDRLYSIAKG